jgi:hypothetical protein
MMNTKIRPVVVVLALVLGLALIFGTQFAVKTYRLEEPFKAKVLSMDGIQNVQLVNATDGRRIIVTVETHVELAKAYHRIQELAKETLRGQSTIEINGKASARLTGIYQQMHFAIYEGIASGKFTQMADQLKGVAEVAHVEKYSVQVDQENVYLKLIENGEVFVKVVPRQMERVAYVNLNEGGESQW